MIIFLIGMPGVGKSTLGLKLAKELEYGFVDTDNWIEQQQGLGIDEIFKLKGEAFFRDYELKCFENFKLEDQLVISCGGGFPCNKEVMTDMLKVGTCVYLQGDIHKIATQIQEDTHRPLLKAHDLVAQLEALFNKREVYFKRAQIHWNINGQLKDLIQLIYER